MALVLFAIPALHAQVLSPIPGFLQDIAGQFPLPGEFILEQQIQVGTQGNSSNGKPVPRSYTTDSPSCSWIHEKLAVPEKHAAHFGLQATLRPASREGLVIQSFGSLLVRNPVPIASWATSGRQPAADLRLLLGNSQSPPVACE